MSVAHTHLLDSDLGHTLKHFRVTPCITSIFSHGNKCDDFQTLAAFTDFTGFSWAISNKRVTTTTLGWDQAQAIFILKGICLRTLRAARTNSTEVISLCNLKYVNSFVCKMTWINWWPILKRRIVRKKLLANREEVLPLFRGSSFLLCLTADLLFKTSAASSPEVRRECPGYDKLSTLACRLSFNQRRNPSKSGLRSPANGIVPVLKGFQSEWVWMAEQLVWFPGRSLQHSVPCKEDPTPQSPLTKQLPVSPRHCRVPSSVSVAPRPP